MRCATRQGLSAHALCPGGLLRVAKSNVQDSRKMYNKNLDSPDTDLCKGPLILTS
jgi:hypothetical protein